LKPDDRRGARNDCWDWSTLSQAAKLGRTAERVYAIGWVVTTLENGRVRTRAYVCFAAAIDGNIAFMDNSRDRNGGIGEALMGQSIRDGYRQKMAYKPSIRKRQ
jgi:hypothetical protein